MWKTDSEHKMFIFFYFISEQNKINMQILIPEADKDKSN